MIRCGGSYLPLLIQGRQLRRSLSHGHVAAVLGLGTVRGNELLAMLDWLLARRQWIEKSLARRHTQAATVMLYDVSSTYLEGRRCPVAVFGHSRDGKPAKQQLVFDLLWAADGCPVAVEVFAGNTADPRTVAGQVDKLHQRCGLRSLALVGDRGMQTMARLPEDLEPLARAGVDLGTAVGLNPQAARGLPSRPRGAPASGRTGAQPSGEIHSPEVPGERLLVCLNPRLRAERARKREDLLQTTEAALQRIQRAVQAKRLRGRAAIKQRVGRDVARKKVAKLRDPRRQAVAEVVARRGRDRGRGPVRWDLHHPHQPERATAGGAANRGGRRTRAWLTWSGPSARSRRTNCRCGQSMSTTRTRCAHTCCCACWPTIWNGTCGSGWRRCCLRSRTGKRCTSPVDKAQVAGSTQAKLASKQTANGLPVHSLTTLLADLATLTLNEVALPEAPEHSFPLQTRATPVRHKAFDLLGVNPARFVASNVAARSATFSLLSLQLAAICQ